MSNITGKPAPYKSELWFATIEAESALLGAILTVSKTRKPIHEVSLILSPSDFLEETHRDIFKAMLAAELPPNQITIAQEVYKLTGGKHVYAAEMCEMIANCPCCLDYLYYAKVIRGYADERAGVKKVLLRGGV